MIKYSKFTLKNGLRVIVHEDPSVQIAVLNVMYDVGSRDETPDKTGFAHLFEHLMFGGSVNISDFDTVLQAVGAENNAFTSPDVTNYYITVPSADLETAFWAESDRMLSLDFNTEVLEVQRKVVIEEFKQRYINQPYGDIWHHLRELAYTKHPYQWPTIGKNLQQIEDATMEDVKDFYHAHYNPENAVLVVGGNVRVDEVKSLAQKWFEPIENRNTRERNLPTEPKQESPRTKEVEAEVPNDAIYKVYHMCDRLHPDYYAADLASDILGRGKSARLHRQLVEEEQIFSQVGAHITGSTDNGLFVIGGYLSSDVDLATAESKLDEIVTSFISEEPTDFERQKVINQAESSITFGMVEVGSRCLALAQSELLGDAELVNTELDLVQKVSSKDIFRVANDILKKENCSTLYYKAKAS